MKDDGETVRWSSNGDVVNYGDQSDVFDTLDEFA